MINQFFVVKVLRLLFLCVCVCVYLFMLHCRGQMGRGERAASYSPSLHVFHLRVAHWRNVQFISSVKLD